MQKMLFGLTKLGHSTTEKLSRSHIMNNKNAPNHNNVKYANGVPYLIFEYKPIKFGRKHMKSEVGRRGVLHITFVYRPMFILTTNKRRIISEFFKDSAIYSVQGL